VSEPHRGGRSVPDALGAVSRLRRMRRVLGLAIGRVTNPRRTAEDRRPRGQPSHPRSPTAGPRPPPREFPSSRDHREGGSPRSAERRGAGPRRRGCRRPLTGTSARSTTRRRADAAPGGGRPQVRGGEPVLRQELRQPAGTPGRDGRRQPPGSSQSNSIPSLPGHSRRGSQRAGVGALTPPCPLATKAAEQHAILGAAPELQCIAVHLTPGGVAGTQAITDAAELGRVLQIGEPAPPNATEQTTPTPGLRGADTRAVRQVSAPLREEHLDVEPGPPAQTVPLLLLLGPVP
jgi:hypothetical protein